MSLCRAQGAGVCEAPADTVGALGSRHETALIALSDADMSEPCAQFDQALNELSVSKPNRGLRASSGRLRPNESRRFDTATVHGDFGSGDGALEARSFVTELVRDRAAREGIASALGVDLSTSGERAGAIPAAARGIGHFPEISRPANKLGPLAPSSWYKPAFQGSEHNCPPSSRLVRRHDGDLEPMTEPHTRERRSRLTWRQHRRGQSIGFRET